MMILPTNEGHPVKRVNYATEVNHGKGNEAEQTDAQAVFGGVQVRSAGIGGTGGCDRRGEAAWGNESQLYAWRGKVRRELGQGEAERQLAAENARLKRQLAEQAEELAILKKAAAYFAKSLK